jgi:hypothetical protein
MERMAMIETMIKHGSSNVNAEIEDAGNSSNSVNASSSSSRLDGRLPSYSSTSPVAANIISEASSISEAVGGMLGLSEAARITFGDDNPTPAQPRRQQPQQQQIHEPPQQQQNLLQQGGTIPAPTIDMGPISQAGLGASNWDPFASDLEGLSIASLFFFR